MRDLDRALSDIADIRRRLADGTLFRGFGPAAVASTGVLAGVVGLAQAAWPETLASSPSRFLLVWLAAAGLAGAIVAIEMIDRSRRTHRSMATAMILRMAEHFAPAALSGLVVSLAIMRYAPDAQWLVPALWQLFMGVGLFALMRVLPWNLSVVAAWYLLSGVLVLITASASRELEPWMMAGPFAIGQLAMGAGLYIANRQATAHV